MTRIISWSLVAAAFLFSPFVKAEEVLFKMDGKKFKAGDLSPATRQNLHEVDLQRYRQIKATLESELLDLHFAELAKKQKKTKEEVEAAELQVSDPSDKELKKFFEENRDKIPPTYTFDQVKDEIKRILVGQTKGEKRQKVIDQLKKSKGFELAIDEPESPVVEIKTEGFPIRGKNGAKVRIVEFADYQCPHCKHASETMKKLMKNYADKIEMVFIDFPINRSGISRTVAEGAFCAKKQNKYWEYHEMAFEKQNSLSKDSPAEFAKALKLNAGEFAKCLGSAEAKTFVSSGKDEGDRVGVNGTPTIYINGKKYSAGSEYDELKKTVDKLL